jgi:dephospho-CoA kinase
MRIFLVAGKSGSGKGEIAKYIKEYYIYKLEECAITSYSKYIKNFAKDLTDWDGSDNNKPRDFMQKIGDEIRQMDPKYFTSNMIQDIMIMQKYVNNIVIADVRMPEEIDEIRDNFDNVYAIYVENQFAPSKLTVEQQAHITETALENYNDFDYVIANDGSLDVLKDKIFKYLEKIQ